MKEQLSRLTLPELHNLFFKETAEFVACIGKESSEEMEERRKRIRIIDLTIEEKKIKNARAITNKETRI